MTDARPTEHHGLVERLRQLRSRFEELRRRL
jgi:hypothetical protein